MHIENSIFWKYVAEKFPDFFDEDIIEFGSYYVNGTIRDYFKNCKKYIGVDWRKGPCVDVVGLAHEVRFDFKAKAIFSASMLEHDPYWEKSLDNMINHLKENGILVLTWGAAKSRTHHLNEAPDGKFHPLKAGKVINYLLDKNLKIHITIYDGELHKLINNEDEVNGFGYFNLVAFKSNDELGGGFITTLQNEDKTDIKIQTEQSKIILKTYCMKLEDAIKQKKRGKIRKWEHHFAIYDSYFEKIQNEPLSLLEIGVAWGGSLFAWQKYFPNSQITGIDINPDCKKFEEDNIKVFIGDQADSDFLKKVNGESGPFDIVIDDGGHMMNQQLTSFKTLFPLLKNGGHYIIEDYHTSFIPKYQDGGEKTLDFLKNLINSLNFWAIEGRKPGYFSLNVSYIGFHNSIVFIKKGKNREGKVISV